MLKGRLEPWIVYGKMPSLRNRRMYALHEAEYSLPTEGSRETEKRDGRHWAIYVNRCGDRRLPADLPNRHDKLAMVMLAF